MIRKIVMLVGIVGLLVLGYFGWRDYNMQTDRGFDSTNQFRIRIVDSVSGKGIPNVQINFMSDCPGAAINDSSCGGKYVLPIDGKTSVNGYLIRDINSRSTPLNMLIFTLGNVSNYNSDIGTGTFNWPGGIKNDIEYKIIPLSGKNEVNQIKLVKIVENSQQFTTWKSMMDRIEKPIIDTREGLWRIYYQGSRNGSGDWMIIFNVNTVGEIVSVVEPMQKVLK